MCANWEQECKKKRSEHSQINGSTTGLISIIVDFRQSKRRFVACYWRKPLDALPFAKTSTDVWRYQCDIYNAQHSKFVNHLRNGEFINGLQRYQSLRKTTFLPHSPLTLCQKPNHNSSNKETLCRATRHARCSKSYSHYLDVVLFEGQKYKNIQAVSKIRGMAMPLIIKPKQTFTWKQRQ